MSTTTGTAAARRTAGPVTDRFLAALSAGAGVPADLFAADAELDATVPNWRLARRGAGEVAAQYSEWFADPGSFEELERHAFPGGEVVTYLLAWEEAGVPHAAHHCHVLRFAADGRIAGDQFFCGGRWAASLLAEMAAASHAG